MIRQAQGFDYMSGDRKRKKRGEEKGKIQGRGSALGGRGACQHRRRAQIRTEWKGNGSSRSGREEGPEPNRGV